MKNRSLWNITSTVAILGAALFAVVGVTFFLNRIVFAVELVVCALLLAYIAWRLHHLREDIGRYLNRIAGHLNQAEQDSLSEFPMPVVVSSSDGEIIWYNDRFRSQVLDGGERYGESLGTVTDGLTVQDLQKRSTAEVRYAGRRYTAYISQVYIRDTDLYLLYYVDNTQLKETAEEYALSRPAAMLVYIDNIEELMQNIRDSERAQLSGKVENLLENWMAGTTGILRKYSSDRFLVVLERRHLQQIIGSKFDILDKVRAIQTGEHVSITLSIGVGQGETLRESEELARQAIEMALGRGGDQAAVKTPNGFDFYGGLSKGIERRTKVRTRVVASALRELIAGSDNVMVMGHRFSDLDCLGSASAMAAAARAMGKPAFVVTQREKTLARELLERYAAAGKGDLFIEPEDAMPLVNQKTLLVITDTHNPDMLEWPPLYKAAQTVVVIDHHRKMVRYIDDAVIFYHEPYSSSASEMVAELVQYLDAGCITRLEAEALLAGIMLDTRSFVMKAGVRTFEAAAYLRKQGADTVEVKRMFSGSMDLYRQKAEIIARAELYRHVAVACEPEGGKDVRVAAAQAADELLSIKGVEASFTLFAADGEINVSARSLGDFNVQLVMEAIGGGGHLTMAGAQLKDITMEEAKKRLLKAVDDHLAEREQSLGAQRTRQQTS